MLKRIASDLYTAAREVASLFGVQLPQLPTVPTVRPVAYPVPRNCVVETSTPFMASATVPQMTHLHTGRTNEFMCSVRVPVDTVLAEPTTDTPRPAEKARRRTARKPLAPVMASAAQQTEQTVYVKQGRRYIAKSARAAHGEQQYRKVGRRYLPIN